MTSNYGPLYASFYNASGTLLNPGADVVECIDGDGTAVLNGAGKGQFRAYMIPSASPTYYSRGLAAGNKVAVYMHDAVIPGNVRVACFTMEKPLIETQNDGMSIVTVTGADLIEELSHYVDYVNIGAEFSTTVSQALAAGSDNFKLVSIGSVSTTLVQSGHPGEGTPDGNSLKVADNSSFSDGDPVCIQLNSGDHTSVIVATGNNGVYDYIEIEDALPAEASGGNKVVIPEIFADDTVIVTLDDSSLFYAQIDGDPGVNRVYLKEKLQSGNAAIGKSVTVRSGQTPTTSDITQIMEQAEDVGGWTTDLSAAGTAGYGTADGTAHVLDGANTLRVLIAASEATDSDSPEWFRWKRTSATAPNRAIAWRASSDASGITLKMSAQADAVTDYADTSVGIMDYVRREPTWRFVSEIAPEGGDDTFSLGDATVTGDLTAAGFAGFTQSLYRSRWIITNDSVSTHWHEKKKFPDIKPKSSSDASKIEAADELQRQAVLYLKANSGRVRYYKTACVIHAEVEVGQSITLDYGDDAPNWDEDETELYIVEVKHIAKEGIRKTELLLSDTRPLVLETGKSRIVKGIATGGTSVVRSGGGATGGGGGNYYAGNNITIDGNNYIHLSDDVVIGRSLSIPENAVLQMWDSDQLKYIALYIDRQDGIAYLVYSDDATVALNNIMQAAPSGENVLGIAS